MEILFNEEIKLIYKTYNQSLDTLQSNTIMGNPDIIHNTYIIIGGSVNDSYRMILILFFGLLSNHYQKWN